MNRINLFHEERICHSAPALESSFQNRSNFSNNAGILAFAGLLIVCSFTVGCSSEKPKPQISTSQSPIAQSTPPAPITPVPSTPEPQATAKPMHKKIVQHVPVTLKYVDNDSGVSFRYPRKYILKTGNAADELVSSNVTAMDFSQPGGVVTAAVSIPEGAYPKSDLLSAIFNVSVNKSLTSEQCKEFSVPPPDPAAQSAPAAITPSPMPKLILGDLELTSEETLGSADARKEDSKYYHAFENGACYEFAMKVATTGVEPDEGGKPVDRDEVFKKLETILATVKIGPVKLDTVTTDATKLDPPGTEKQTASTPVAPPAVPAQ
jgi:hypothetical protein